MLTPLSRACSTIFQGLRFYSCQSCRPSSKSTHLTWAPQLLKPNHTACQDSLSGPKHFTFTPTRTQLPHSTFPDSLPSPRPCCWHTFSIKLALAWIWISLPPTNKSTHALSSDALDITLTVLLENISFILQMKILRPKKNKIISPSSYCQ